MFNKIYAASLLLATTSFAVSTRWFPGQPDLFDSFDTNYDAYIDKAEMI